MASTKNDLFDIFDFNNLFKLLKKNWYWVLASVFFTLSTAYIYIKITPEVYEVSTSVIKHKGTNSIQKASEQLLNDQIRFISESQRWGQRNDFKGEILVFKSSGYLEKAIEGLDLEISYFQHNKFIKKELFQSAPFLVILKPDYPQPVGCEFTVKILSDQEFKISLKEKKKVYLYNLTNQQNIEILPGLKFSYDGRFDETIHTENMDFKLLLNSNFNIDDLIGKKFSFRINTKKSLVYWLQEEIEILPKSENILGFSMETSVPQKSLDILNSLTHYYTKNEFDKKLEISEKAIDYIDNQLYTIQGSLKTAEAKLQRYQSSNSYVDINQQSEKIFDEIARLEREKSDLENNLRYYKYIDDYFKENSDVELIAPSAMGIQDERLSSLITELIDIKAEKLSMIENEQDKSPYLRQLNIRIENLQKMTIENIAHYTKTSNATIEDINSRISNLNKEANELPQNQRELLGYEKQYEINEQLFSYLTEKKAEAEIAKASIQSEVEILEPADVNPIPVAPKKLVIIFVAFALGILIPVFLLLFMDFNRKTFSDSEEIFSDFDLPIIGKIYHNNKNVENVVSQFPTSHISESFRKIRSQIDYFVHDKESRIITISSAISEEGKSFISKNLAASIAASNFKTVLLGFDLRKPKSYPEIGAIGKSGLSEYLSQQVGFEEIIQKSNIDNLDVILAGSTAPPNPAELIASPLTEELLETLQSLYDYIIIDTPPVGLVTDGLPLVDKSDLHIFVIRLKRSLIEETSTIIEELSEKKKNKLALVVNDVPIGKKGQYGYGYYDNPKK